MLSLLLIFQSLGLTQSLYLRTDAIGLINICAPELDPRSVSKDCAMTLPIRL